MEEIKKQVHLEDSLDFLNENHQSKYAKYFFSKVRTKKEIVPQFEMSRSIDGVIQGITFKQPVQKISGKLNNIEFSKGEFQGQEIKSIVFKMETLNPSNELFGFRISCSRNQAALNWMNCLIGFNEKIDSFEISLWKDKNTGFNKSTCRINGKKPSWAFTLDQMEEKKEKIFDKKGVLLMVKTDELFDFMEDELKNKLDILLPNRWKEEESKPFDNFVEESLDGITEEEFTPDFTGVEETNPEDYLFNKKKNVKK